MGSLTPYVVSAYFFQVRASNMVRAGESLMKLVSDLKQYLILNDFPSVNEAISQNSNMFKEMQVYLVHFDSYFPGTFLV